MKVRFCGDGIDGQYHHALYNFFKHGKWPGIGEEYAIFPHTIRIAGKSVRIDNEIGDRVMTIEIVIMDSTVPRATNKWGNA